MHGAQHERNGRFTTRGVKLRRVIYLVLNCPSGGICIRREKTNTIMTFKWLPNPTA